MKSQGLQPDRGFVAEWGKWLSWDGQRWRFDTTLAAFDLARDLCKGEAAKCNKKGDRKAIASAKTVAAVVTLARADRRLAATADQWDADPWLINTPDGIVDLRTGRSRPQGPNGGGERARARYVQKLHGLHPPSPYVK